MKVTLHCVASLGLAAVIALAGCGDNQGQSLTADELLAPGPFGVGERTVSLVDPTRPTPPTGTFPGSAERNLKTEIWYPTTGSAGTSEPQRGAELASGLYPLVIYSHGFMSSRLEGAPYAEHLASHGLVVAAPDFPLAHGGVPFAPTIADVAGQAGDVSFLIDEFLSGELPEVADFAGHIDPEAIGVAGLSLGAMTTLVVAFHPTLRDPRVRGAHAMAPGGCFFQEAFFGERSVPLLMMGGTADMMVPFEENQREPFERANPPKLLVEILGGSHIGFAGFMADALDDPAVNPDQVLGCPLMPPPEELAGQGAEMLAALGGAEAGLEGSNCPLTCSGPTILPVITGARQQEIVRAGGLAFFDAYLRGRAAALEYLRRRLADDFEEAEVVAVLH